MVDKIQYQRLFLMFKQEDGGYGNGQEPSGYAKIEVKEAKGRITLSVQNLKEDLGRFLYKAYALKCNEEKIVRVPIGIIPLKGGRGDIQWEFDPNNVEHTMSTIDEFNAVVVLAEFKDGSGRLVCPLAAYRDKKLIWRDKYRDLPKDKADREETNDGDVISKQDVYSKYNGGLESKYSPDTNSFYSADEILASEGEEGKYTSDGEVQVSNQDELIYNEDQEIIMDSPDNNEAASDAADSIYMKDDVVPDFGFTENSGMGLDTGTNVDEQYNTESCKYRDMYSCVAQSAIRGYNPCAQCFMNKEQKVERKTTGNRENLDRLKDSLNKYFEAINPFRRRRRDYKWWKISNPVYLNNFLFQCSIKTPLLFNPRVLMANYKYRHLIFGIYTDVMRRKEFIVCGIPGAYNVDENPFGEMCRWVQVEGNRPKYGAFGYWLVYIDPLNGKLISFR